MKELQGPCSDNADVESLPEEESGVAFLLLETNLSVATMREYRKDMQNNHVRSVK